MRKLTFEFVKSFIEENSDCKLLSDVYEGKSAKMSFLCGCGDVFITTYDNFKSGNKRQCNKCGYEITSKKQRKYTQESFEEKIFDLVGFEYTVLGKFENVDKKILFKHNYCGHEWEISPDKFMGVYKRRCPKCNKGVRRSLEDFKKEVSLLSKEYLVLGNEYKNSDTKIKMKHINCGHEFEIRPNDFINNSHRCPSCAASKGEKAVAEYLTKKGLKFVPQYKLKDCRVKRPLPFDFALLSKDNKLKCLIEYDGEGHYKPFRFSKDKEKMKKKLFITKRNDNIKNAFCKENNIKLIRIPYTIDNIENYLEEQLSIL